MISFKPASVSMPDRFVLFQFFQQTEYDLVIDDQVAFVLAETVAGHKHDEVCAFLFICVFV